MTDIEIRFSVSTLTPERCLVWAIIQQAIADCKPFTVRKKMDKGYKKIIRRNTLCQRDALDFLINRKRIEPLLDMLDVNYDYWIKVFTGKLEGIHHET